MTLATASVGSVVWLGVLVLAFGLPVEDESPAAFATGHLQGPPVALQIESREVGPMSDFTSEIRLSWSSREDPGGFYVVERAFKRRLRGGSTGDFVTAFGEVGRVSVGSGQARGVFADAIPGSTMLEQLPCYRIIDSRQPDTASEHVCAALPPGFPDPAIGVPYPPQVGNSPSRSIRSLHGFTVEVFGVMTIGLFLAACLRVRRRPM